MCVRGQRISASTVTVYLITARISEHAVRLRSVLLTKITYRGVLGSRKEVIKRIAGALSGIATIDMPVKPFPTSIFISWAVGNLDAISSIKGLLCTQ